MRGAICALMGAVVVLVGNGSLAGGGGVADASTPKATARSSPVRPVNVIDAPTLVADTASGAVGYREVGTGSPILLIMGLGGSMDDWPPSFVASLAAHHEVVMFDNAGVGDTASLPAPLSVPAMAGQASALLSTLRLGRVAVLGWSMGGMIAQALAALHRAQVSKLVLAATQSGNGRALPIPPAAGAAAASSDPTAVLSVLFPADQSAAAGVYVAGILRYPGFYQAPRTTITAQEQVVEQWIAGGNAAGTEFDHVKLPTLVADGTLDALDPNANDRSLADSVPGAKLLLYPGAGHAFLFQDAASFVPAVEHFVG
jgi:pimeloyl-ACP methyl ester carboxylesterase